MSGQRVGHYVVHERLGAGGAGSVYRAVETSSGRAFALKVLDQRPGNAGNAKRFEREVSALSRLDHPNLVRVHDHGVHQGRRYLVMDLVEGESIEDRIVRSGPLTPAQAAEIARVVAGALQHVHEEGLIHRDVKPANVMLATDGTPFLSDFGLVKDLDPEISRLTLSGVLMGTPGYWAPELASGHPENASPLSDVYGLGALLYGALTGRAPLDAESLLEMVAATHSRPVDPPSALNPAVDAALDGICLRCLEKEPSERFPSAGAVALALASYLEGAQERHAPRRPIPVGIVALAGASLAALLMIVLALVAPSPTPATGKRPTPPPSEPRPPTPTSPTPPPPPPRPTPEPKKARPRSPEQAERYAALEAAVAEARWVEAIELAEAGVAVDAEDIGFQLSLGYARMKTGDLWGARRAYDRVIALEPEERRAYSQRGACHAREGSHEAAVADFDAALRLKADDPFVLRQRAASRFFLGQVAGGERDLKRALELAPNDPKALHIAGMHEVGKGRLAEAQAFFDRALSVEPLQVVTLVERGRTRIQLGRPDGLKDLDQALALAPNHARARLVRGSVYLDLKRFAEAEEDLVLASQGLSRSAPVFHMLGVAQYRQKRYTAALPAFDRALGLAKPPSESMYRFRGLTHKALLNYPKALADLDRALKIDPNVGETHYERARVLQLMKVWDRSSQGYGRAIEFGYRVASAYNGRGYNYLQEERNAEALAEFDQAIARQRSVRFMNNRALALQRLGRHEEALRQCEEALRIDPDYVRALFHGASSRAALGDVEGALRDLNAGLAKRPRFLNGLRIRGMLFADLGRVDEAKADLETYLEIQPQGKYSDAVRARLESLR